MFEVGVDVEHIFEIECQPELLCTVEDVKVEVGD